MILQISMNVWTDADEILVRMFANLATERPRVLHYWQFGFYVSNVLDVIMGDDGLLDLLQRDNLVNDLRSILEVGPDVDDEDVFDQSVGHCLEFLDRKVHSSNSLHETVQVAVEFLVNVQYRLLYASNDIISRRRKGKMIFGGKLLLSLIFHSACCLARCFVEIPPDLIDILYRYDVTFYLFVADRDRKS